MPTYPYKCPECKHEFESTHSIKADKPPCPICESKVERIFTAGWKIQRKEPHLMAKDRMK